MAVTVIRVMLLLPLVEVVRCSNSSKIINSSSSSSISNRRSSSTNSSCFSSFLCCLKRVFFYVMLSIFLYPFFNFFHILLYSIHWLFSHGSPCVQFTYTRWITSFCWKYRFSLPLIIMHWNRFEWEIQLISYSSLGINYS